ncbi:MAG: hypothetical protein A2498_07115 [Lentisphaerae bacterium RIFOXYC12_FULL_60_16]|nr:MAG: hypothetical protein A2498_07115 [Lentisphaerae bacterium RIFOXYC12_FULL_60_16]OGV78933.1 MAG: hypothetical protein A2340_03290 [Lentisphaerae bacterium RIFOXYB12_FULL_60_10]
MNSLDDNKTTGLIGELLVQLRLLEHGVQAAPPMEDSGNDLIAIKGEVFKAIQVKTTEGDETPKYNPANRVYHLLAIVRLVRHGRYLLDKTPIYLVPIEEMNGLPTAIDKIDRRYLIDKELIHRFFG